MLMIQKPMNMIWAGSVACDANPAPTHAVRNGSKSGIATTVNGVMSAGTTGSTARARARALSGFVADSRGKTAREMAAGTALVRAAEVERNRVIRDSRRSQHPANQDAIDCLG